MLGFILLAAFYDDSETSIPNSDKPYERGKRNDLLIC